MNIENLVKGNKYVVINNKTQKFEILLFDRSTTKFYFFKRLLEDNMVINIMLVIKFYRIDEYEEIDFILK
jgi:hypothetical protein